MYLLSILYFNYLLGRHLDHILEESNTFGHIHPKQLYGFHSIILHIILIPSLLELSRAYQK
jgi:hypothetical protein